RMVVRSWAATLAIFWRRSGKYEPSEWRSEDAPQAEPCNRRADWACTQSTKRSTEPGHQGAAQPGPEAGTLRGLQRCPRRKSGLQLHRAADSLYWDYRTLLDGGITMVVDLFLLLPPVAGAIVGGIIGAASAYYVRRRLDQKALTIQQIQYFHSSAMVEARIVAWDYLKSDAERREPKLISYFYAGEGVALNDKYQAIIRVKNFWLLLSVLKRKRLFAQDLARATLKHNWRDWKEVLTPLFEASKENG